MVRRTNSSRIRHLLFAHTQLSTISQTPFVFEDLLSRAIKAYGIVPTGHNRDIVIHRSCITCVEDRLTMLLRHLIVTASPSPRGTSALGVPASPAVLRQAQPEAGQECRR